jgi:NTP pyrophosphatase (non-canonical NTP hydrolase)
MNIGLKIEGDAQATVETAAPAPGLAEAHGEDVVDTAAAGAAPPETGEPGLSWAAYAAWRRTKARKPAAWHEGVDPEAQARMLLNSALGLCGECGEFAEIWAKEGISSIATPESAAKILNEAGDIIFYCMWAIDAMGSNPVERASETLPNMELYRDGMIRSERMSATIASSLAFMSAAGIAPPPGVDDAFSGAVTRYILAMASEAGKFADSVKKHIFHERDQDPEAMVDYVLGVLHILNRVLAMCGLFMWEAAEANVAKLNARYPDGYKHGGGNRTGEGA